MAEDAITLITRDHREMERLFDRLETERDQRPRLLDEVEAMLIAHSRAEEDEVYPVVVRTTGEVPQVRHSAEEHQEAEELLGRLRDCEPDSDTFDERLREFVDAVKHHVEEEESEILPALKRAVGQKRVTELGTAFSRRRAEELELFDPASAKIPKQRLYEQARHLDVPNRSKMSKEELAEAVQEAAKQH
ncbi:hemerythrin domain-containing protein [Nocardiopsis sp. NRRL B-16309]|uniref:hemerythrin domain-containing protein n=1 Tax=Nocardiopsis sp. NRRL B-16309 TaxID=1519494 RepID=UPI0006AEFF8C|nr:hemerythrin domain-containing protein [Nocardiopsis sp. NRRL B-16309]KOX11679.1 hemerythrin [Nocardiopsis sp. NRRL B-16309]